MPDKDMVKTININEAKKISQKNNLNDSLYCDKSSWKNMEDYIMDHYDLKYNLVSNEIECKRIKNTASGGPEDDYTLANENNIFRDLRKEGIFVSTNHLISLLKSGFVQEYNPFVDYFKSLSQWDENQPDYITILANYVKANDQDQFNHHFKKMLIRTVACALDDKYYNKTAFIIVGEEQHTGKSTFIRFLCPTRLNNYISETLNFQDKDSLIGLSDNFIFNIDELAALKKVEVDSLKTFFSKDKIKIRHPYDRKPKTSVRRVSFFGSTNNTEFLSDATGSVRWICFDINEIDWKGYSKSVNIDQVWSQAYSLFKNNSNKPIRERMDLTPEEIKENEIRNQTYQISSPEIELIQKYYQPSSKESGGIFMQPFEIRDFFNINHTYLNRQISHIGVGKALKLLGFKKVTDYKVNKDFPVKGYYVKTKDQTQKSENNDPF